MYCFRNLLNVDVATEIDTLLQNITQTHDIHDSDRPISIDKIISNIKSIHANQSLGPDGICIEMLKFILNEILSFLNILFNEIFDKGELPANWCEIICSVYKRGFQKRPDKLSWIFLISCTSKLFTGIITTRFKKNWAKENSVINESQAGFRKR